MPVPLVALLLASNSEDCCIIPGGVPGIYLVCRYSAVCICPCRRNRRASYLVCRYNAVCCYHVSKLSLSVIPGMPVPCGVLLAVSKEPYHTWYAPTVPYATTTCRRARRVLYLSCRYSAVRCSSCRTRRVLYPACWYSLECCYYVSKNPPSTNNMYGMPVHVRCAAAFVEGTRRESYLICRYSAVYCHHLSKNSSNIVSGIPV